jgi:hypothetical protein
LYLLRRFHPQKRQKSDIDQVLVVDAADRQRDLREPSDAQRIALITRLGTASRSAGLDADKLFTEEDLRRMEMDAMTTHNDLEQVVNWIIANESNGDFSRDAWQFITRIPINKREIPIIRTRNIFVPCILVYGIVHDLIVRESIYLKRMAN